MAIGALLGLLIAAAPASALTTRSATTSTPLPSGQLAATASCHKGEKVVSGGFTDSNNGSAVVSRAAGDDGWTVRTYPGDSGTLTVYAYCSNRKGISAAKNSTTATHSGPNVVVTAKCGQNESVVSGGYELKPRESNSPVFKSRRGDVRSWSVMAVFDTVPADLEVFAYCQRHADVTVRSATGASIGDEEVGSATAHCHRGEQLLSGGYSIRPTPDWNNATGPDPFFYQSAKVGKRGWMASAHNYSAVSGKIVAYAYCAS